MSAPALPNEFIKKRLHSFTGLFLVLFLIQHLLTNSQAALLIGDDGHGFIESANSIHSLPYLPVIEVAFLGIPILIHMWWGILYALQAKYNSFATAGNTPSLPQYARNKAYSWQRITSWILVLGIIAHVVHMRFLHFPDSAKIGHDTEYLIPISDDPGLPTLAERLDVTLIQSNHLKDLSLPDPNSPIEQQNYQQKKYWNQILEKNFQNHSLLAVTKDFGTAELLMVRDTFKHPLMMILYTFFVLAATYHAFNGLWTFMISWGVTLSPKAQKWMLTFSYGLMGIITFLGLAAIWLTYWVNLKS